jgi:hypothetical protein
VPPSDLVAPRDPVPTDDLVARAGAWMAEDPDPQTRAELAAVLERSDEAGLRDRFSHPLEFGTAGLRGQLGAGPARMNLSVVRRTTGGGGLSPPRRPGPVPLGPVPLGPRPGRPRGREGARSRRRPRRPAPFSGLRPGHRSGAGGCGFAGAAVRARPSDAHYRLRGASFRRCSRRHGHRQPQPGPRQRLQGLRRRRCTSAAR